MTRLATVLLLALLAIAGGDARADDIAAYQLHYQRAREDVRAGDLRAAVEEFEAAYAASPNPDAVFDAAVVSRQLALEEGRAEDARRAELAFRRYVERCRALTGTDPPGLADVERYVEELRAAFPVEPPRAPSPPPRAAPPWIPPTVGAAPSVPETVTPTEQGGGARYTVFDNDRLAHLRHVGGAVIAVGLAVLALSAVAAALADRENTNIRNGGFATLADLNNAFSTGTAWNAVAIASVVAGGLLTVGGLARVLTALPRRAPVGVTLAPGPHGVFTGVSLRWP